MYKNTVKCVYVYESVKVVEKDERQVIRPLTEQDDTIHVWRNADTYIKISKYVIV